MARLRPETHEAVREGAIRSAEIILPIVGGRPAGVLDVGAGGGAWLDVAHRLWPGASMLGVDLETRGVPFPMIIHWDAEDAEDDLPLRGGPSAERDAQGYPKTGHFRWPLVLCLEVAEHLTPAGGEHLVAELCRVAERVVWSAAIPGQGGDGHVNEQAPSYWGSMFNGHGFYLSDPWRVDLWRDDRVEPWYRQNLLLAQPGILHDDGGVGGPITTSAPLHLVHPATFLAKVALAEWWRLKFTEPRP